MGELRSRTFEVADSQLSEFGRDRSEARWQWVEEVKTPIIGAIFKMLG